MSDTFSASVEGVERLAGHAGPCMADDGTCPNRATARVTLRFGSVLALAWVCDEHAQDFPVRGNPPEPGDGE